MQLHNHIISMVITTSVIFSKSAINKNKTFLDAVINILYYLSFIHYDSFNESAINLEEIKCSNSLY